MARYRSQVLCWGAFVVLDASLALLSSAAPKEAAMVLPRITVLYDAFGTTPGMQKDWGYAAYIQYAGKRILFDTGNNPSILLSNAKARGINLSKLDFVVMSHRHGDHMAGLAYVLSVNPGVKVYAPKEGFGVYGADLPGSFYRRDTTLPREQRYYDGSPPDIMRFGSAWRAGNFELVNQNIEILPGVRLVTLVSNRPGTLELRELALTMSTPKGLVMVVGCSHPGVEKFVEPATSGNNQVRLIMGGFHLVTSSDTEIGDAVTALHDRFKVDYVAPGHCTGEPGFAAFRKAFGDHFLYAGLGTTISAGHLNP